MNLSTLFSLNWVDVSKGLVVAVLTAVLSAIVQALQLHSLNFAAYDWMGIAQVALLAAGGYLSKNFLSDSSGKVLGRVG